MRKVSIKHLPALIAILFLLLTAAVLANARHTATAAGSPTIESHVIGAGGGSAASGIYTLDGTLGQPVTGVASTADTELCSGFWCQVQETILVLFRVLLPIVIR